MPPSRPVQCKYLHSLLCLGALLIIGSIDAIGALYGIAILSTIFRLGHRAKIRKLWWDDFWATLATLMVGVSVTIFFADPVSNKSTFSILFLLKLFTYKWGPPISQKTPSDSVALFAGQHSFRLLLVYGTVPLWSCIRFV